MVEDALGMEEVVPLVEEGMIEIETTREEVMEEREGELGETATEEVQQLGRGRRIRKPLVKLDL